jgi:nitroreductase
MIYDNLTQLHNNVCDDILKARHTIRAFSHVPPSNEVIEKIVQAGLVAPFAAIPAAGRTDFRKVFIISTGSQMMADISAVVKARLPEFASELEEKYGTHPFVLSVKQACSVSFQRILGNAPYLIIALERKGLPAIASESLSYYMHNMWIRATSLKVGFRLLAIFSQLKLGNDKEFCSLLNVNKDEFAVSAGSLGYVADDYVQPQVNYPDYESNVKWF